MAEPQPKYQRIASDLRDAIAAGQYPPGSRLPSITELMERYGVALATVKASVRELVRDGLAEARQGSGTFALEPPAVSPDGEGLRGQVAGLQREVAELRDQVAAMSGQPELTARVGRIEANLMALYGQLGHEYPRGRRAAAGDARRSG